MKQVQAEKPTISLIKGVSIRSMCVKTTLTQEQDTWGDKADGDQYLSVDTPDSGGGNYLVIETERWAMDKDDIDAFAQTLKDILKLSETK